MSAAELAPATSSRRLWSDLAQVWVAVTLTNVLFYLFQIMVVRGLGPGDYGLFGALLGIVYLAAAASNAINACVAGVIARQAAGEGADARKAAGAALGQMLIVAGVVFALVCLAAPFLRMYLHGHSLLPILLTNVLLFLALVGPVVQGALLGEQRFAWYSASQLLNGGSRLLLGGLAIALGFGVAGALGAVVVALTATMLLGLAVAQPRLTVSWRSLRSGPLGPILLPMAVGFLAISMPTSADVLVARHFFASHEAGLYAGVAALGRIILFLPLSVSLVLYPKIAQDAAAGRSSERYLPIGVGLSCLLAGAATLVLALAPRFVLTHALGTEYAGAQNILAPYAIASFLFSVVVFLLYFHLAQHRFAFIYAVLAPHIALELVLPYFLHGSPQQLVAVLLWVNASLLVCSLLFTRASLAVAWRWPL